MMPTCSPYMTGNHISQAAPAPTIPAKAPRKVEPFITIPSLFALVVAAEAEEVVGLVPADVELLLALPATPP